MMDQLIYRSRAVNGLSSAETFKIIEISARNNPARDITGFLIFGRGEFLQLIEGPDQALDQLLSDLAVDPRHTGIEVLARRPILARSFPNWRMQRLSLDETSMETIRDQFVGKGLPNAMLDAVTSFVAEQKELTQTGR